MFCRQIFPLRYRTSITENRRKKCKFVFQRSLFKTPFQPNRVSSCTPNYHMLAGQFPVNQLSGFRAQKRCHSKNTGGHGAVRSWFGRGTVRALPVSSSVGCFCANLTERHSSSSKVSSAFDSKNRCNGPVSGTSLVPERVSCHVSSGRSKQVKKYQKGRYKLRRCWRSTDLKSDSGESGVNWHLLKRHPVPSPKWSTITCWAYF